MKFPGKKTNKSADPASSRSISQSDAATLKEQKHKPAQEHRSGYTPPKGRPTPKRRDVERARGIRHSNPGIAKTPAQLKKERQELKASMSKEEWKEHKRKQREENRKTRAEVQRRMDAGDERYLLPRDQGPERAMVRDWVDARRFLINYMMALVLLFLFPVFGGIFVPRLALLGQLMAMAIALIMIVEAITIGIRANRAVRSVFPDTDATGFSLGFYAYNRASQPRRWRSPKPRVEIGESTETTCK